MSGVAPLADGWPTLSELKASTFGHVGPTADRFDGTADKAQSAFEELAREVRRPGGVEWEGAAGNQAANQADADLVKVRGWAWYHRQAAGIARRGQDGWSPDTGRRWTRSTTPSAPGSRSARTTA